MSSTKIAILGGGQVGNALGDGFKKAGHVVVFGSRTPGDGALSFKDAVAASEVAILTTPYAAAAAVVAAVGDFANKILVDATNAVGPGMQSPLPSSTSGAEEIAKLAKGARVVKCFNTTGVENMITPKYGDRRSVMFAAGDDAAARAVVVGLANDLGFEGVDAGALARSRQLEDLARLWISLTQSQGRGFAFALLRR